MSDPRAEAEVIVRAIDGEIAKLGARAPERVTAVQNFLSAQLGEPLAKHMATMLVTAQHAAVLILRSAWFSGAAS
jgi:hypothetical protein